MIRKGTAVEWKKNDEIKSGKVVETATGITGEVINNQLVTRRGLPENKALIIKKEDGGKAVKLESEIKLSEEYNNK